MNEVSPKIIRVWFDTILNPIIDGLNIEYSFLKKNNLTWRGFNSTFEGLKPIHTFFHYRYHANFEHLTAYHPVVLDIILEHDEALSRLRESCHNLYHKIKDSKILKDGYKFALQSYLDSDIQIDEYQKNKFSDENNYKYIAEYILNDIGELDSAYNLSPVWNPNLDIFKNIINNEEFSLLLSNQQNDLNNFNIALSSTLKEFKNLRISLSSKFGEPLVMPEHQELHYA